MSKSEDAGAPFPVDESHEVVDAAIRCISDAKERCADDDVAVNQNPNGVKLEYSDKTKVELKNNESSRVQLNDGTIIEKFPNGRQIIHLPNGVMVETKPDGTKLIRSAGSNKVVKELPDGRKVVVTADEANSDDNSALSSAHGSSANLLDEDTTSDEEEEDALVETLQSLAEYGAEDDDDDDEEDEEEDGKEGGWKAGAKGGRGGAPTARPVAALADGLQRPGGSVRVALTPSREGQLQPGMPGADMDLPIHNSIVACGWLWKEGGQIRSWKKRYFQLTEYSMLEYYDKEPHRGGRFINVVDVFGGQVSPTEDKRRPHSFYLYVSCDPAAVSNKRSKYKLAAMSGSDREMWMEKLRDAANNKERRLPDVEQRPVVTRKFASRVASLAKGPSLANTVRKLVSKKKVRYQKDGFDLDLTYITPHIIAMGYPAEGTEAVYRNNYEDVYRLLQDSHSSHYKVYNLCSERAYPAVRFHNRVAVYPFDDHNAPPLDLMLEFCRDLESYLGKHPRNVAAIHCKAGKGRTGVMICAYFLYSKHAKNPDDAMFEFGSKRTANGKGVTIPSQRRYIRYFADVLGLGAVPPPVPKILNRIHINDVPNFDLAGGCQPYFNVFQDGIFRYTSKPTEGAPQTFRRPPSSDMAFQLPLRLEGDVKIEFLNFDRVFHQDERMFTFTFYTGFLKDNKLRLARQEIDGAHKKKHLKIFPPNFAVTLYFDDVEWGSDSSRTSLQITVDEGDDGHADGKAEEEAEAATTAMSSSEGGVGDDKGDKQDPLLRARPKSSGKETTRLSRPPSLVPTRPPPTREESIRRSRARKAEREKEMEEDKGKEMEEEMEEDKGKEMEEDKEEHKEEDKGEEIEEEKEMEEHKEEGEDEEEKVIEGKQQEENEGDGDKEVGREEGN